MTALSPSEAEKIAAEAKAEAKLNPSTHEDVKAYIAILKAEITKDPDDAPIPLKVALEEAEEMLTWDESDLPSKESLMWEE